MNRETLKKTRFPGTLAAILRNGAGPMRDSRIPRGGASNEHRDLLSEIDEDDEGNDRELDCWD